MKLGPEQNVQMPMKTVISLIIMVSLGTMGYFQIQEKLNQHDTLLQMHTKDLDQNSEFRIKYPRGELGQSSGESELFMLVEHMAGQITKMEERMEDMMSNSVNIERLQKDVEKVLSDIEKEFRIKYPRGELGQSSGESELFMLVEHMAGQITKMEERMEDMMSNSVNIERLQKDVEKVLSDIEKLKDKQRTFANGNNTP